MKLFLIRLLVGLAIFHGIRCTSFAQQDSQRLKVRLDSVWVPVHGDTLFGILYSPLLAPAQGAPGVLCLQGGGDVGLGNYFFEPKMFAELGFMALVCDKPGSGLSKGNTHWTQQTFEDKLEEYFEILDWLKYQKSIDPSCVGVHGMSEGGRLAVAMAIQRPDDVAFVNSVSGPLETFKDNHLFAIYNFLGRSNPEYPLLIEAVSAWDQYLDEVESNTVSDETVKRIAYLRDNTSFSYLPAPSKELPDRPLPQDVYFSLPGELTEIKCPVLFQYGELDRLVNVSNSIALIPELEHLTVVNYSGVGHNMSLPNGTMIDDYFTDKEVFLKRFSKQ